MSRRGAILEGYQAPPALDVSPVLEGMRLSQQDRQFNQELQQRQGQHAKVAGDKRDEELNKMYDPSGTTSGTIYDPTGMEAMQGLQQKAQALAKSNPNLTAAQIQAQLAPEANKIAMYYQKAKTIKEGADKFATAIGKNNGYNTGEIGIRAQQLALIDPKTGKIRDDINSIDPTLNWGSKAIEAFPLETTTNEGIHDYIKDSPKTPVVVGTKFTDKKGGVQSEKLELNIPASMELEKDARGFHVKSPEGNYSVVPKSEVLPDGTKVLSHEVFADLQANKPSYYTRIMGEATHYIKAFNAMNGQPDAPIDPTYANTIARKLAYEDMKTIWGNGGVKSLIAQKEPPAPRITINNGSGKGSGEVKINDVYAGIIDATKDADIKFANSDKQGTRMNTLNADAQKVIFDYIGDKTLDQSNTFIVNDAGKINVYKTNDEGQPEIDDKFLITTLPKVGTNIKAQPNAKAKVEVVKQGESKGKTFNVVDPNTGKVVMSGVDQSAADKAKAKGYKIQ